MPQCERIGLQAAAERLGLHYMTVYRYVRTGQLPAVRDGATWTVAVDDLELVRTTGRVSPRTRTVRVARPARLADRMTASDEAGAWAVIEGTLSSGVDAAHLYADLLVPTLRLIGDEWERGELSVAAEHRASVIATRLIGRLGPRFARRGRTRGSVVLGAPPGELHALPGAMLSNLLRSAGFEPLDLGASAPASSFVETALGADRLVAVLIGATTSETDATIRDVVRALRSARVPAPILVGGSVVAETAKAQALGADGWTGATIIDAMAAVESAARNRR